MLAKIDGTFRVVADPELRQTNNGVPVLTLRGAANKNKKQQDGSWENIATHWANLNFWREAATEVAATVSQGDQIRIVGEVTTQEWEKDGQKRSKDQIEVEFFRVFKKDGGQQASVAGAMQQNGYGQQQQNQFQGQQQQGSPWGGAPQQQQGFSDSYDQAPPF